MAFGIDVGPSSNENNQYNNLSGLSGTAANTGLTDLNESGGFMSAILSGDPTKIGQVLAPQIQGIQQQGQQKLQTNSQFGNRGGGTNASNQTTGDTTRSNVNNMVSSLTGQAVSGLNSTGTNLVNTAATGFGNAFSEASTMQQQNAAKWNDIIKSIGAVVGGPLGAMATGATA